MIASLGPLAPQATGHLNTSLLGGPARYALDPLQDVVTATVPDPASIHVSSDDTMNLSRDLADIMDRELFEQACQHREVQYEEQLESAHRQAFSDRRAAAEDQLRGQAEVELALCRSDAQQRLHHAEQISDNLYNAQVVLYQQQAEAFSMATVRDVQSSCRRMLAEAVQGNQQHVKDTEEAFFQGLQSEFHARVEDIRQAQTALQEQRITSVVQQCRLELVTAETSATLR